MDAGRFIEAQEDVYDGVVLELQYGEKITHWMWFVFPQIEGLGRSSVAQYFSLADEEEAMEYLKHDLLGERLLECTELVYEHRLEKSIHRIFTGLDVLKFHASMTLFASISEPDSRFHQVLDAFFDGEMHSGTLDLL